jgi:hypothetical protein
MPEDDERAGFDPADGFDAADGFDDQDYLDDDFDVDETGSGWTSGFPPPFGERAGGRHAARRGLVLAATALVAAGFAFGVAAVAMHDVSANPAASVTPSASSPAAGGSGGEPTSGADGGAAPLPSGAMMQLEIGGQVTAVSATSITIGSGDRAITAAVTSSTEITGKVTSIGGVKVGDLVSASISGTAGKLTADTIQDPASLPSGPGQ